MKRVCMVIHHGMPVDRFSFQENKQDYALFIGRMSRTKGLALAIQAVRKAGMRLVVACKDINTQMEREYFDDVVKPLLGPDVEFLGEVDFETKVKLYGNAQCTVIPTSWEEPFGLTAIESIACGTPVVGLRRGATAEIIENGVTGYLGNDVDDMVECLQRISTISPHACRKVAVEKFSAFQMVNRYEDLYRRLVAERGER